MRSLAFLLLFLPGLAVADRCTDAVAAVDKDASEISNAEIEAFLDTFRGSDCKSVEYAEWANEMVFTLMEKLPDRFFRALKHDPAVTETIVVEVLDHPIHDLINYPAIMTAIESGIAEREVKDFAVVTFRPYYDEHVRYRDLWEKQNDAKWTYGG